MQVLHPSLAWLSLDNHGRSISHCQSARKLQLLACIKYDEYTLLLTDKPRRHGRYAALITHSDALSEPLGYVHALINIHTVLHRPQQHTHEHSSSR
jgi:hypothetical protein